MTVNWVVLAAGCLLEVVSVLLWRHREGFVKFTAEGYQALYGDRSKVFQRAATPQNVAYPAIGAGVIGLAAIALALFGGPS
jgi:multidrug transporter EmrE-like cation transporter